VARAVFASDTLELSSWRFCFVGEDSSHGYADGPQQAEWRQVEIPHSYNLRERLGSHKAGFAWYSTSFSTRSRKGVDSFLELEGIALRCKVFLDGRLIGRWSRAYLPFSIDITSEVAAKGEHTLSIQVDNRLRQREFPDPNCNGWWIYGGIIREVRIVQAARQRIENPQVRTFYLAPDSFRVTLSFVGVPRPPDSVRITVAPHSGGRQAAARLLREGFPYTFVVGGVKPWSPSSPLLYDFSVIPYWDNRPGKAICVRRGFAQLRVVDGGLWLNERPIFLRGIGRHDVIADRGPLLTREERLADLVRIKSTGANMLRIAHFPQHRDVYEICDSLGIIVMDEMPAWKTYPVFLGDTSGQRKAKEYMQSLIDAHGNYTSVAIWCIGNEIQSIKGRVADYVRHVSEFTKSIDPSRLVTYTSYFYQFDRAYQYVDIVSVNEYFGWYVGSIAMLPSLLKSIRRECPSKPLLVSEFGASAGLGIRNADATPAGPVRSLFSKDFSEDYQALFHKEQIETIWKCRRICHGAVVWCYNDFMEAREMPNPTELVPGWNGMGIVTNDRKPKSALTAVDSAFTMIAREMVKLGGY